MPTKHLAIVGAGSHRPLAGTLSPAESPYPRVLSLDAHGRILDWMHWQDAVCLYVRGAVSWTLGEPCMTVHAGQKRFPGDQSVLDLQPIVAACGHAKNMAISPTPALTNTALFARDGSLCMYCGKEYSRHSLTRDHVMPISRGGEDSWENLVCACVKCNNRKGDRTPDEAGMPLIRRPMRPNHVSFISHFVARMDERWKPYLFLQ